MRADDDRKQRSTRVANLLVVVAIGIRVGVNGEQKGEEREGDAQERRGRRHCGRIAGTGMGERGVEKAQAHDRWWLK